MSGNGAKTRGEEWRVSVKIDCTCRTHMLEVEDWGDGDVYLSCWRLATPRHEYGTLGHRLREAWRALRGWDVAGDEYVLDRDGARKLAAALASLSESGEDSPYSTHWLRDAGFGATDVDDDERGTP